MKTHDVASIVFVSPEGDLIFQQRDDKPGIRNPGKITAWGGACEGKETPLEAAVREVTEETNLHPEKEDFSLLGIYPRNDYVDGRQIVNHVFILNGVVEKDLEVHEGQGYVTVPVNVPVDNPLHTNLTDEIIHDYKNYLAQHQN